MGLYVLLILLMAIKDMCLADLSTAPITTTWIPKVSRKMVKFAESQTGALQLVKAYDEKLNFTEIQIDGETQLHQLTQAAGDRLKMCRDILHRNKAEIEASHAQGPTGGAPASDCCDNLGQLEYDPRFLQQIVNDSCATFTAVTGAPNTVRPSVYDTMKSNIHDMSGATWQYYGAKQGEYHQFPQNDRSCEGNDHRFRNWYVSAASPKKKNVVIVIDVSLSMQDANRLDLAKQAALTVLDTFTARDWAGVVSFSDVAETPAGCLNDSLGEANQNNIDIMRNFINNLRPMWITYYAKGFEKAFEIFERAKLQKPEQFDDSHNVIIFLTDGEPSDPQDVLDQITEGQNRMGRSVHIFTYGLGNALPTALSGWCDDPNDTCSTSSSSSGFLFGSLGGNTAGIPALDFLATIADQNNMNIPYSREWTNEACRQNTYGPCFDPNRDPQGVGPPGRTDNVRDGEGDRLMTMVGSYYDFFQSEPEPTFSVPTKDDHLGLIITAATRTVDATGALVGVTAVDISMDIVFHEIANFNIGKYSYAFLVDREDGRVILHRDLPKPMEWSSDPVFLHLDAMKGALTDDEVTKILNGNSGNCYHDYVTVSIARGNAQFDGVISVEKAATFYYEPIPDTKYSVVLCLFEEDRTITVPSPVNPENGAYSLYHRLDLLDTSAEVCRLYDNYATFDGSTVMFPPESYSDPIDYMSSMETSGNVADINNFINDFTGSVPNPRLVDGVRTDVVLTSAIEQYWKESDGDSVWRYVGTRNGMFRIFPGITVDRRYDPTQHPWFNRALSRPQDYTFSRPVPSPFGGGNMVTISKAITHSSTQKILGVVAADIIERRYTSLMTSEVPECSSTEYDCFTLDVTGYFLELPTAQNMEHDHLTNRFPWLAKELVSHGEFLKSGWCQNYATQNSQLFYDTSGFTGLAVTTGPPCQQFSLYPVNGTNTFLLVLLDRQTHNCADSLSQNCSCVDVCQSGDVNVSSVCQYPCTCSWDYYFCTSRILTPLSHPPCPPPYDDNGNRTEGLPDPPGPEIHDCDERCSARTDNITCEALSHCDWCGEWDVPVCRESCLKTTLKPATATGKPEKTTVSNVVESNPNPILLGSLIDCSVVPVGMYPDPQDCTMFYQCIRHPNITQPFHMPCAPGTLFDWNLSVCTLTSHCTIYSTSEAPTPAVHVPAANLPPTTPLTATVKVTAEPSEAGSCSSSPCKTGGTCQDDANSYTCVCPPYSAGRNCETVWQSDKCYRFSDNMMSNQQASSACVSMNGHLANIQETAQQQLLASYMVPGHDGSFWVTNKISLSSSDFGDTSILSAASPWMFNNGSINFDICVLLNDAVGYKGTYQCCEEQHSYICESAAGPCQPNVCQNGGYCISCFGESSVFCICPQGYSGPLCEIVDLCEPNPCPFDWTCSIQAGGIHCAVPTGAKATSTGFCAATSCGPGLFCIEDGSMGYSCIRG